MLVNCDARVSSHPVLVFLCLERAVYFTSFYSCLFVDTGTHVAQAGIELLIVLFLRTAGSQACASTPSRRTPWCSLLLLVVFVFSWKEFFLPVRKILFSEDHL